MTGTPINKGFRVTWSYSSLNTYDICPLKYYHEKIAKTIAFVAGPQAAWGLEVHKALEDGAKTPGPVKLPLNMRQYQKTLDNVKALAARVPLSEYERQFAVTRESQPCSWTAVDAFGRCAADVFALESDDTAIIIDYKTGKYRGKTTQAPINAQMVMWHYPKVERVKTVFAYVAAGVSDKDEFTRDDIREKFLPVERSLSLLVDSVEHENFPAKPGFLCRNWCEVFECPHNGRDSRRV